MKKQWWERANCRGFKGYAVVVVVGGTQRPDQINMKTSLQSYHSCLFPSNVKRFPHDTENRARGKSAKTTDRVRSPPMWFRICLLCEPHSHLHMGERNQASATTEHRGNERPDLSPPWAEGLYGLGGQGDLLWNLGLLRLFIMMLLRVI